jgi:hypothetical protein
VARTFALAIEEAAKLNPRAPDRPCCAAGAGADPPPGAGAVHHINRRRQYNLLYPRRGIMMDFTQSYHTRVLVPTQELPTKLLCTGEARVVASGRLGQTFLIGSAEAASAPGRAGSQSVRLAWVNELYTFRTS